MFTLTPKPVSACSLVTLPAIGLDITTHRDNGSATDDFPPLSLVPCADAASIFGAPLGYLLLV